MTKTKTKSTRGMGGKDDGKDDALLGLPDFSRRNTAGHRRGFKQWPLVQWPTKPLPYAPRRHLMKINKKVALLQLPKQDFYSFKLCTVDSLCS